MHAQNFPWQRFLTRVAHRFVEERFDQISASLAFTTLLSVVPLVAVVLSIVALVPVFPGMVDQLAQFLARNLLPERNAGLIIDHVLQFSQQAVHVTTFGSLALGTTALLLLLSIERVFNHVWSVAETRPWWHQMRLFAALVTLWPLVLGGVVLATSYAVTTSLGLLDEPPWLRRILFRGLGLMVASLFLGGLYYAVPNTRVASRDALFAGVIAALGFQLLQKGFELYLANFPSYTVVYGAFATVPLFLLWLYLSWAIVLVGALVAATLPEFRASQADTARR